MQEITRKVNLSSFPPSHHLLDPLEAILADQVHALDGVGLDHLVPGILPDDLGILLALLPGPLVDDKLVVALQVETARHLPPIGRHLVELLALRRHLRVDRVEVLCPAGDRSLDPERVEHPEHRCDLPRWARTVLSPDFLFSMVGLEAVIALRLTMLTSSASRYSSYLSVE